MSNYNKNDIKIYTARISNVVPNKNNSLKLKINNNIKQLNLNNKVNKQNFKEANLVKFLSFLNNTICIPKNLRIVCHSHIMQDILGELDITINDNLNNILKENLWTLFINLNNRKKISISRHGFSNANLIKEKQKSIIGKLQQISENDATLTVYGILTSLLHSNELILNERDNGLTETPNIIFVSVLIRTWMTSVCLYLPHCDSNIFQIIVSPFIKEKGLGLDNQPNSFDKQISIFNDFLNYLFLISNLSLSNEYINKNLYNIKNYFNNKNSLIIYGQKIVEYKLNNDKIEYKIISEINNFFNKICYEKDTFQIETIDIFHGQSKPLKNSMDKLFTRWCEPFSKKIFGNHTKKCKDRLNNIGEFRKELYERPNNNIEEFRDELYEKPMDNIDKFREELNENYNNIGEFREELYERPNYINNIIPKRSNNNKKF